MSETMFTSNAPTLEDQWRGIILYGRNVASYKFALAKALLELSPADGALIKMEELAAPFARHVAEHLQLSDKQGTFATSKFLDACRRFNQDGNLDVLTQQAVRLGFNNVIDAFHVVGNAATPQAFFIDERVPNQGIRITSEFAELLSGAQANNLATEVESRWRLVETAWSLNVSKSLLSISYDSESQSLFSLDTLLRRKAVTGSRGALNGYQKGKCFYCFRDIHIDNPDTLPDVDHFFPHCLKQHGFGGLVDGIWNLVLACRQCNRGIGGKSDKVPSLKLLERLWRRNEYLVGSQHPLRETIIQQTGKQEAHRKALLNDWHTRAWAVLIHQWEPEEVAEAAF